MQIIQEMISVCYQCPYHSENKFNIGHDQDLLGQMSVMREKATESEAVVRNITKDIQVLDTAKKNLILSMTTLKRLQMLGTQSETPPDPKFSFQNTHSSQCLVAAGGSNEREEVYRGCANSCRKLTYCTVSLVRPQCHPQAVKEIAATFHPYAAVHHVAQVSKRIQEVQGNLRMQLDADFDAL